MKHDGFQYYTSHVQALNGTVSITQSVDKNYGDHLFDISNYVNY